MLYSNVRIDPCKAELSRRTKLTAMRMFDGVSLRRLKVRGVCDLKFLKNSRLTSRFGQISTSPPKHQTSQTPIRHHHIPQSEKLPIKYHFQFQLIWHERLKISFRALPSPPHLPTSCDQSGMNGGGIAFPSPPVLSHHIRRMSPLFSQAVSEMRRRQEGVRALSFMAQRK